MKKLTEILRWAWTRDYFRFILVGMTAFVVDFSINALLYRGLHADYRIAFVVGVLIATGWAFLLNKLWAFQDKSQAWGRQTFLFFGGRFASLAVTYFLQVWMVEKGAAWVPAFWHDHPVRLLGLTVMLVETARIGGPALFNPLIAKMINGFVNFAINYVFAKLVVFRESAKG